VFRLGVHGYTMSFSLTLIQILHSDVMGQPGTLSLVLSLGGVGVAGSTLLLLKPVGFFHSVIMRFIWA
jgi:hypothetical protein